ncbi:MAG TPA: hypothetical protein VII87_07765 [Solirubrobacteraceae bacterium]
MKRLSLLAVLVAMLVAVPAVLASSGGTPCTSTASYRHLGLHVNGLSCHAAYQLLVKGSAGYKCHTIGQTKKIPVKYKCVNKKHKSTFYIFLVYGG